MRKLSPDEVASLFRERDEIAARERARGSGLPPDFEALASRIFGEEKAPDFGDSLERLTVALVALRAAFVPDPPSAGRIGREAFLQALERIASAAGSTPTVVRGDISTEAPTVLVNPLFWLAFDRIREEALAGDERALRLLGSILDYLTVSKRRFNAGRVAADASRIEAARDLFRDPDFMDGALSRLAVDIVHGGKRGPVPLRAAELVASAFQPLQSIRALEAERKRSRDPEKRRALRDAVEERRSALARLALAMEGRRDRAEKLKREKTRGRK